MAASHTVQETEDWFDKVTVSRNMKELTNHSKAFSKIADMAVHPDFPKELAYKIEIPEGGSSNIQAEEVDIFEVLPEITPMLASADMVKGEKLFKKCASCHTFNKGGENKVGPAMWGIVNRSKASSEGFAYSGALVNFGGDWNVEELNKSLREYY